VSLDLPQLTSSATTLLQGVEVADALLAEVETARKRLWGCYFIVGIAVSGDPHRLVRDLGDALCRAASRGVDVRMLMDDYRTADGLPLNQVAAHYLASRTVQVRLFQSARHSSTHSKYLLIDDDVQIVGSGNLSHGALSTNLEMALRVESPDLLRWLGERFLYNWELGSIPEPLP